MWTISPYPFLQMEIRFATAWFSYLQKKDFFRFSLTAKWNWICLTRIQSKSGFSFSILETRTIGHYNGIWVWTPSILVKVMYKHCTKFVFVKNLRKIQCKVKYGSEDTHCVCVYGMVVCNSIHSEFTVASRRFYLCIKTKTG